MFTKAYGEEIKGYFLEQRERLEQRRQQLVGEGTAVRPAQGGMLDAGRHTQAEGAAPSAATCLREASAALLERKIEEIDHALEGAGEEEAEALRFLYSAMPVSDMLDYPADVFLSYAKHAVFLWNEGPYAGKAPEKLFANYVLHHRINNEDITDTRRFFYDKLIGRIKGLGMYDAAMAINIWCSEEATYQMTDPRAQNPVTMYYTGIGRCGEESTFAITVLRALGIPARQVYAPLWSHCDSNHAWVEAWCDGTWRILGACEPEEELDMGWFIGPSTRAMQIHSRWYGKDKPQDRVVGKKGMSLVVNHLGRYAPAGMLKVRVEGEDGKPVNGARVDFNVLNGAHFGNVAFLETGAGEGREDGCVTLETGFGSLLVCAYAQDGRYGETLVTLNDREKPMEEAVVVLHERKLNEDVWQDMDFYAPRETVRNQELTDAQIKSQEQRLKDAAKKRQAKAEGFYQEEQAQPALMRFAPADRKEVEEILRKSLGHLPEILHFLEWDGGKLAERLHEGATFADESGTDAKEDGEHWKLEVLKVLTEKDYWDLDSEVLKECCDCAAPYVDQYPKEIFYRFLLSPRVAMEMLRPGRGRLAGLLGEEEKRAVLQAPETLPDRIGRLVVSMPDQEYGNLITSPIGCLTGGIGNEFSRAVLCVNLYRALGIPARLRRLDRAVEFYRDGKFWTAEEAVNHPGAAGADGSVVSDAAMLHLHAQGGLDFSEWGHYSVSKYEKGQFRFLFLGGGKMPQGKDLEAVLEPGMYRAVTTNRLPNGNQFARVYDFVLHPGESKHLELTLRQFSVDALLRRYPYEDCLMRRAGGKDCLLSELAKDARTLFLWLETGREPTEHILNELYEKREQVKGLTDRIYLITRSDAEYEENATLRRFVEALPGIGKLVCDSGEAYRRLSESVEQNPGRLPLAMVMEGKGVCIYSDGGYNVGMADLLLRILNEA